MHDAAGEGRVLAVVDDGPVEAARVLEGVAHQRGVGDGRAVVAEGDATGARQLAELGQELALRGPW